MMPASQLAQALVAALDDAALDALATALAPRLAEIVAQTAAPADGWMTTRQAAQYLRMTPTALHKLTAARAIPFEQEAPGCRCWFRRSDLDAWRRR